MTASHYKHLMTDECLLLLDGVRRACLRKPLPRTQIEQIFEVCQQWPPKRIKVAVE